MSVRSRYWGSSRIINWVRNKFGHEKPNAATSAEWKAWKNAYKKTHPKLFWFTEDFIDGLQDLIHWPIDKFNSLIYAINARFKDKYWCLSSKLNKWKYHEIDDRMLECNFETLRIFVECEKAAHNLYEYKDGKFIDYSKKYGYKWYHKNRIINLFVPEWSSKEAGINHLNWEINLNQDEEFYGNWEPAIIEAKASGEFGKPTCQAIKAQEILDLYLWWTEKRPRRPNPEDVSGYTAYWKERNGEMIDEILSDISINDPDKKAVFDIMNELEEQYTEEDTEMLVRLMKIRRGLWS